MEKMAVNELRIVYLLMAGGQSEHLRDEQTQRLTWSLRVPINSKVVWVKGSDSSSIEFRDDTLFIPINQNAPDGILNRSILAINWCLKNFDFDFIIRSNVSTFFEPKLVNTAFPNKINMAESFIGGYVESTKGNYLGVVGKNNFISGSGIFMNRAACLKIALLPISNYQSIPDDVAITAFSRIKGISVTRLARSNIGYHHYFFPAFFTRCKSSINNELASKRMTLINSYWISTNGIGRTKARLLILHLEIINIHINYKSAVEYLNRVRITLHNYILIKLGTPG